MKILVIGSGGREHALIWKLARDSTSPALYCAPGNAGTALEATNLDIPADDVDGLLAWAKDKNPDLTVVGPESPLCAGIVDRFEAAGLRIFGPSRAAAQLEGSKVFSKSVMEMAGVPTAIARSFTDARPALAYVRERGAPLVIKADGLAAGKGVTVCADVQQAEQAVEDALVRRTFRDAGRRILIEEFLEGEEVSILALVDGKQVVLLASAQDHKRAFDHDEGPNTGGMGAYSPAPVIDAASWPRIRRDIFEKTLSELRRRKIAYKGVLYAGLMLTSDGPRVLEFNCRFGDPETQAILPRWSGDLLPALEACVDGTLSERLVQWTDDACVCVVMASRGYPGPYEKGMTIEGLDRANAAPGAIVFHAGTRRAGHRIVTDGGRVLGVTATGKDLKTAVERVYSAASEIRFDGAHYRKDIAWRALHNAARPVHINRIVDQRPSS